jgi:hypothetical protein
MLPLCVPLALGVKTMRTVHETPAANVVTPDTQSARIELWIANSLLFDVSVTAPLACWPTFVMVKLCTPLAVPVETEPKERLDVAPQLREAGDSEVPDTLTLPRPPGSAEKLTVPLRSPVAFGENPTRTVHEAPAANVVTHETQSVPVGLWMANSLLSDDTQTAPLGSWPVFVMVKLCAPLAVPAGMPPKERFEVPPELRDAGASEVPDTLTLPRPPGSAEKLTVPLRSPVAFGENTMRTVQDAPASRVVTPESQSVPVGSRTANSLLSDVTLTGPLRCWPVFVMLKLCTSLAEPDSIDPKESSVVVPDESVAGERPLPDTRTLPPFPGLAEKVTSAERSPLSPGVNTILTLHEAPPAKAGPQSPASPVVTTNSSLLDETVTCPLGVCPVLVMVKRSSRLASPTPTESNDKLVGDAFRLAGVPARHAPPPASKKPAAQPVWTQCPVPSSCKPVAHPFTTESGSGRASMPGEPAFASAVPPVPPEFVPPSAPPSPPL